MTLEVIQKDMIAAMKSGDKPRKEVLASLVGAIKKAGIDGGCRDNIPEEMVNSVLLKEVKTVKEQIETCPKNRTDMLEKYNFALSVVNEYAPQLITDEAGIKALIESFGIEISKSNRGMIMKELKGKVDMKVANKVLSSMM